MLPRSALPWLDYFFFLATFFAAFFAAFLVAIDLFSLSIRHRSCNRKVATNRGIDLLKFSVKKNRYVGAFFLRKKIPGCAPAYRENRRRGILRTRCYAAEGSTG